MTDAYKIIRLSERFSNTGEPTVQIVSRDSLEHTKVASDALDYIKNVEPVEGKTIILVLAASGGQTWGPNKNGDAFPEEPIPSQGITEKDLIQNNIKSFESGGIYRHHANRNPAISMGRVLKAFWHPEMHRVELLLELDNTKAGDIVDRINAGEYPAVSMGTKITHDCCSICGNKAPTRAQYCDHCKYELGRVYPDGRKVFLWNPSPRFFDISFVTKGADRVATLMRKVAEVDTVESSFELGDKVAAIQEKVSTLKKLSDIDKIINGQVVAASPHNNAVSAFTRSSLPQLMSATPNLDEGSIDELSKHPMPDVLSSLGAMGITPTVIEITKIMIHRAMPGAELPPHVEQNMANMQGPTLDMMAEHPEILQAVEDSGVANVGPEHVNQQLMQKMSAWREKRSNVKSYLERRIFGPSALPFEASPDIGNLETYSHTDPASGQTYKTTRGAINASEDANYGRQLKTLAGAGLLTGVGYKALSAHKSGRMYAPLMLAGGALGAAQAVKHQRVPGQAGVGPTVADKFTGDEWDSNIPLNTELRKSGSIAGAAGPLASSAAVTAMLAQEYNKRQQDGTLGTSPRRLDKTIEGLGSVAATHPGPTFIAGLGAIGLGRNLATSAGKFILKTADAVELPSVDFEGLSHWLGEILFSK